MRKLIRGLLVAMTLVLVGVLPGVAQPGTAGAYSDTQDQAQTINGNITRAFGGTPVGQTFTADTYGTLDRVSVYLTEYDPNPASGPVTVGIWTVTSSGVPGRQISSGTIAQSVVAASPDHWVDASVAPVVVAPGGRLAIVLSTGAGGEYLWYEAANVYSGGSAVYYDPYPYPDGSVWHSSPDFDAMFQTYVIPDPEDQCWSATSPCNQATASSSAYQEVDTTRKAGQTFTAGQHGLLDRVRLNLSNVSATGDVLVSIQTVTSGGLPDREIGTGIVPFQDLPTGSSGAWVDVTIRPVGTNPVITTTGAQYAIILSTAGGTIRWYDSARDIYPNGSLLSRSGTTWATGNGDEMFVTYVIPPMLDQYMTGPIGGFNELDPGHTDAQTFTAGITGFLDHVTLFLRDLDAPNTSPVTVSIERVTSQGWPSGLPLAKAEIPAGTLSPYSATLSTVAFGNVTVDAGTQYAIVVTSRTDYIRWIAGADVYAGGRYLSQFSGFWSEGDFWRDGWFQTYIVPVTASIAQAVGYGITPCSNGICPAARADFTPADLTNHVGSHVQFQERPDGTVHGVLSFSDPRPDGIRLQGCTTESASCRLMVTTFARIDQHAIEVDGRYTLKDGTESWYALTLSGTRDGIGTFSFSTRIPGTDPLTPPYSYTLTQAGIVDVTCPPDAG